jgi:hypothetical protein
LASPEWIEGASPAIACKVNGRSHPLESDERYINLGAVKAGDKAEITLPISERNVTQRIGVQTYSLLLKGSTVVSIVPPGRNRPLYRGREKYRGREAAWKNVARYVPEQDIRW